MTPRDPHVARMMIKALLDIGAPRECIRLVWRNGEHSLPPEWHAVKWPIVRVASNSNSMRLQVSPFETDDGLKVSGRGLANAMHTIGRSIIISASRK